jgi:hypothetical protein
MDEYLMTCKRKLCQQRETWKARQSRATAHLPALARKHPLCANDHGPHDDYPDD